MPCTKCKNGKFIFKNSKYVCTGNISEWAKCDNVEKEPKRIAVLVPDYIKEAYSFLADSFKVRKRAVKEVAAPVVVKKVKKEEANESEE